MSSQQPPPLRPAPDTALSIAFVITGLGTGGAEMMLEKLVSNLSPSIEVHVISLTGLGAIGPRLQARGVPVEALGMRPGLPSPRLFARLVRRLTSLRPNVVHTWMYHADLLGGLAARLAGVRALMWGLRHSNLDPAANKASTLRVVRLCARLSAWLPQRIACAAQRAREAHIAIGYATDRMVVIPNGFDLTRFVPDSCARADVRTQLGLPDGAPLIGMVGRFDPQKNHRGFATAMQHLLKCRPDVHALLAGDGVDSSNQDLMRWLRDAGAVDACHLLGRRDDVPRLMSALDVLVLPSIGEAFPNVVGEAMSCGVPCAVTDVGDAADIVGALGRVVGSGDMAGLAAAVAELLALPAPARQNLSSQAQQTIRQRFDIAVVARRYEDEYRSMVAATRRPD
ncbi:MAG TPA: glycosyltransferase [Rubrivivax sp.]|nr:glycosyltransferase [Rubrivivax sp.]HPO20680.1 glycosyltransferase [Rubrivivax sp.]